MLNLCNIGCYDELLHCYSIDTNFTKKVTKDKYIDEIVLYINIYNFCPKLFTI